MKLKAYLASDGVTQAALADDIGCDQSFISKLAAADKPLPPRRAIRLFRLRGVKLEPLAGMSDAEIDVLERFENERAA